MVRRTRPLIDSGRIAVVLVAAGASQKSDFVRGLIREHDIQFPMLAWEGKAVPYDEWNVGGNPIAYLVDPEGTIAAGARGATPVHDLLTYLEAVAPLPERPAPVRLSVSTEIGADGFTVLAEVGSPMRVPLTVAVDYRLVDLTFDESGKLTDVTRTERFRDVPELTRVVACSEGESLERFEIPGGSYEGIEYAVRVLLPGSEQLNEDRGCWTAQQAQAFRDMPEITSERF
jgi:hypothetical protein